MAQFLHIYDVDLAKKKPAIVSLNGMYYGDVAANRIGANVFLNKEPVSLGGSCSGTVIRSDGQTVAVSGTVSGNTCYIDLPAAAYAVAGPVRIYVTSSSGGKVTTLVEAYGTVELTETPSIAPSAAVQSVSTLIDAIEAAVETIPPEATALWATIAPPYSSSSTYTVGDYCTYNAKLYRCRVKIAAGESFDSTKWTQVDLGSGIGSALSDIAAPYDKTATYSVGDYCTYQARLYRCNYAIGSGGEDWNLNHWTRIYVGVAGELLNAQGNIIAARYDPTSTYAVGDYCIYNGLLYRCTTPITTAESWTSGHWTRKTVTGDIQFLNSNAADITSVLQVMSDVDTLRFRIVPSYSLTASYAVGDYCTKDKKFYRCKVAIAEGGEAWDSSHWTEVTVADELAATNTCIAAQYDPTATYAVGDYCLHQAKLYRCNTAITTAEDWTLSKWSRVYDGLAAELVGLKDQEASDNLAAVTRLSALESDTGKLQSSTASAYSSSATYAVGDYCIYNGSLYRCNTAISTAEEWTSGHWTAAKIGDDVSDLKIEADRADTTLQVLPEVAFSGSPVHFKGGIDGFPFNTMTVEIVPSRSGTGNPSPTNKRAFAAGLTSASVYVSPTYNAEDAGAEETVISFPAGAGAVYRGTIDLSAKKLIVQSVHKKLTGSGSEGVSQYATSRFRISAPGFPAYISSVVAAELLADILTTTSKGGLGTSGYHISASDGANELLFTATSDITTVDGINTWLASNNVEIDYPLSTPVEYALTDEMITMLQGENYVWSNAGEVSLSFTGNLDYISTEQCAFVEQQSYKNLFNPNDSGITVGYTVNSSNVLTSTSNFCVSGYIPCKPSKTYMFPFYTHKFGTGSSARTICLYDTNKEFVATVTGTLGSVSGASGSAFLSITIPSNNAIRYFRVNVLTANENNQELTTQFHSAGNFMIIEGSAFPDRFYPFTEQDIIDTNLYSGHENLNNPLYGKRAVFLGDSICEGDSLSGWAGRIGTKNTMLWENDGIMGSTISTVVAGKPICTRNIKTLNPDYVIFEGGTNDADHIGSILGEEIPEAFGTFSETDWGTDEAATYYGFDIGTYCGALDYLCKRLIKTYPGAKIGYIVAQKMGVGTTNYTPTGNNRRAYFEQAMKSCKKWGIPYINLWDGCYLNPQIPELYTSGDNTKFYSDGQHLLAKGYDYISAMIEAWMKTL